MPTAPSPRTRLRRLHDKAAYDRRVIDAILDSMPVAHVGHVVDGFPVVTPTLQWREGDRIYWHGSSASRMQKHAAAAQVFMQIASGTSYNMLVSPDVSGQISVTLKDSTVLEAMDQREIITAVAGALP